MAKRRRLTPMLPGDVEEGAALPAPETKSMFPLGVARHAAPIAQVAGSAATAAALDELSGTLRRLQAEGRVIQRLALDSIDAGWLTRDRIAADDADMAALMESLRARGQQTPVEVMALEGGRHGLISGWRRVTALRRLQAETGEDRFSHVLAILRRPETAADAYLAMVEENEIRVGLSYYERARIVAQAAAIGVYASPQAALRGLFASASRAKRSKIGSFLPLVAGLGGALRFPAAIPERLGLALDKALAADADLAARLSARLAAAAPASPAAELALLTAAIRPAAKDPEPAEPVHLTLAPDGSCTLSGPGVDAAFLARLRGWLAKG